MVTTSTEDVLPGTPSDAARQLAERHLAVLADMAEAREAQNALAKELKDKPYFFAREVLGNEYVFPEKPEGSFKELFDQIYAFADSKRYVLINSPRNSYKTTLVATRLIYLICFDRSIRILYLTNVHGNAVKVCQAIRRQLAENEVLIRTFGEFQPAPKPGAVHAAWTDDKFFVTGRSRKVNEPTFTIGSLGTTKVGNHYDVIVIDDAADRENSQTADGCRGQVDWYQATEALADPRSLYGPGTCIMDQGTRYADADLHGWLLGQTDDPEAPTGLYDSLILQAMDNPESWDPVQKRFIDPILNFPFVLTADYLAAKRQVMGEWWFYTQYQNECLPPSRATFKKSQFKLIPWSAAPPMHELLCYVLTDYGEELREENDKTALWVIGLDWRRFAWALDLMWGHFDPHERVLRTVALVEKYNAIAVAMEKVTGSSAIIGAVQDRMRQRRLRARIEIVPRNRAGPNKLNHIRSLQPRFEAGEIAFVLRDGDDMHGIQDRFMGVDNRGRIHGPAIDEMVRFPRAPHDDLADALAYIDKRDPTMMSYCFSGASPHTALPQVRQSPIESGRLLNVSTRPTNRDSYWGTLARRMTGPNRG